MNDNLGDLLDKLATALEESRAARLKMEAMLDSQFTALWDANAELRDELHSTNAALANRIEGIVRL